jgi:hypothetical protein
MMPPNDRKIVPTETARLKGQPRCTSGPWKKTNGRKATERDTNHRTKDVAKEKVRDRQRDQYLAQ